ncbi:Txe/YoeB family addiction module toxin [Demequina sp. NBRC 110054]|uniref:Txe/YoeB family addiction module toxin n=1 Tax=Demequina sp. NBRC 110054 TaxID=1570343 RepID=UPI000A02CF47|nr:Txe/YoeB family addiction module toxin [Demequina sp. NBRC 110054]
MRLVWDESAWDDYLHWQQADRRVLKRINLLVRDILRGVDEGDPNAGLGKPELLKHGLSGYSSRRITAEHRLVYKVVGDELRIAACRFHYE